MKNGASRAGSKMRSALRLQKKTAGIINRLSLYKANMEGNQMAQQSLREIHPLYSGLKCILIGKITLNFSFEGIKVGSST